MKKGLLQICIAFGAEREVRDSLSDHSFLSPPRGVRSFHFLGSSASRQAPPRSTARPRRAAGSTRRGLGRLRPTRRLQPSPSPSRQGRGPVRQARGSSRRRRGGARRRESRGYVHPAGGRRSVRAGSRWGSVRSRPPASPRCSGPAAAASTRRTAARPWLRRRRAPRTRAPLRRKAPAAAASGRTRALQRGGLEWLGLLLGLGLLGFQDSLSPAAQETASGFRNHPLLCSPGPRPRLKQCWYQALFDCRALIILGTSGCG